MKAKDLRVGNLIGYYDGNILIVDGSIIVKILQLELAGEKISDYYTPIRLTEEWLIRFEFFKDDEDKYHVYYKNKIGYTVAISKNNIIRMEGISAVTNGIVSFYFPSRDVGDIDMEYVHHFQNLYFAIEGQELIDLGYQKY